MSFERHRREFQYRASVLVEVFKLSVRPIKTLPSVSTFVEPLCIYIRIYWMVSRRDKTMHSCVIGLELRYGIAEWKLF